MADDVRTRLADARLYLCTDARRSRGDLVPFLDAVLGAGVDIIQLREVVQERDVQVAALTIEVDHWRGRALDEHAVRGVEQREAVRRERDLVTVLHSELIRNETLTGELAWRRRPWFRRLGQH